MAEGVVISPLWFCFSGLQRDLASFRGRGTRPTLGIGNEVKDKRKEYKNKKTQERNEAARGMMNLWFPGFRQKVVII